MLVNVAGSDVHCGKSLPAYVIKKRTKSFNLSYEEAHDMDERSQRINRQQGSTGIRGKKGRQNGVC